MGGIGIIHNPFAKGNLKRPWILGKLREAIADRGVVRETRNVGELPQVAREFMDQGIEIMAVNGGDGTLHLALTAFVPVYSGQPLPKLMSLRGGTMNTMSNSLKIKGKSLNIIKRAVRKLQAGEPFKEMDQHLLKVNDKYGFMSGAGVIANFLDVYYSGSSTGPWQAAKLISRTIGSALGRTEFTKSLFRLTPALVVVDGQELAPREYRVILACTIRELGLGFTPTPRAYDRPGHFHFIGATIPPIRLIPLLPALWFGRDLVHPEIEHTGPVKAAVVNPIGKLRWMVDGEVYDADGPLHFSVGPSITVVAP